MSDIPPIFTVDELLAALKAAAKIGLTQTRNGESDLTKFDYDIGGVQALLCECVRSEIHQHSLSDRYPEFQDYVVILKLELEGERVPFYVKVALCLPKLMPGELMSFHPWGYNR